MYTHRYIKSFEKFIIDLKIIEKLVFFYFKLKMSIL